MAGDEELIMVTKASLILRTIIKIVGSIWDGFHSVKRAKAALNGLNAVY